MRKRLMVLLAVSLAVMFVLAACGGSSGLVGRWRSDHLEFEFHGNGSGALTFEVAFESGGGTVYVDGVAVGSDTDTSTDNRPPDLTFHRESIDFVWRETNGDLTLVLTNSDGMSITEVVSYSISSDGSELLLFGRIAGSLDLTGISFMRLGSN